jgi:hypothetical protein
MSLINFFFCAFDDFIDHGSYDNFYRKWRIDKRESFTKKVEELIVYEPRFKP